MICLACGTPGATFSAGGEALWCDQPCFAVWDRRAEAEEALELAGLPAVDLPETAFMRRVPRRENLVGERFGRLVVERSVLRHRRNGWVERLWRCRCDCGRAAEVSTSRLRKGTRQCKPCGNAATARGRERRFAGATVRELAARAGLPTETIWTRIRRGVPVDQLTAPAQRPPTRRAA